MSKRLRKAVEKRRNALWDLEAAVVARFDQAEKVQRAQKRLTARKAEEAEARRAFEDATVELVAAAEEEAR